MPITRQEVLSLFIQLWPPGRLYDWYNPASYISRFFDGVAEALKTFGYDFLDRLRREINPATWVEKLPDWEHALDLADEATALEGTIAQRQAAVIAKLREFGAFTLDFTRATIGPLLGFANPSQLLVVETDRAKMRAAHTYSDGQGHSSPASSVSMSVYVPDGGVVSDAGAQVLIDVAAPPGQNLHVVLTAPGGQQKGWTYAPSAPPSTALILYAAELADVPCNGQWRLLVENVPAVGAVMVNAWSIFVEGSGLSGLGGDMCDWGVYADPTLEGTSGVPSNQGAAARTISRIQHAHTKGHVLLSLAALPDHARSLPDQCLPV